MTDFLEFTVVGVPRPKGSTRSFMHYRTARVVTQSDNAGLKDWERLVGLAARRMGLRDVFAGPVELRVVFFLTAPQRRRDWPTVKPDLSKLVRGVEDPLSNLLYRDDAQICRVVAEKRYCVGAEHPGAVITLRAL